MDVWVGLILNYIFNILLEDSAKNTLQVWSKDQQNENMLQIGGFAWLLIVDFFPRFHSISAILKIISIFVMYIHSMILVIFSIRLVLAIKSVFLIIFQHWEEVQFFRIFSLTLTRYWNKMFQMLILILFFNFCEFNSYYFLDSLNQTNNLTSIEWFSVFRWYSDSDFSLFFFSVFFNLPPLISNSTYIIMHSTLLFSIFPPQTFKFHSPLYVQKPGIIHIVCKGTEWNIELYTGYCPDLTSNESRARFIKSMMEIAEKNLETSIYIFFHL